jgi:acylphosphatase
MKCYQVTISGKVTHKGFRFGAMQTAYKLGITGFVQYRSRDTLLIEAEGKEMKLKKFIDWCTSGPVWAKVAEIKVNEVAVKGYSSFNILHDKTEKFIPVGNVRPQLEERKNKSLLGSLLTVFEFDLKKSKGSLTFEKNDAEEYLLPQSAGN